MASYREILKFRLVTLRESEMESERERERESQRESERESESVTVRLQSLFLTLLHGANDSSAVDFITMS